MKLIYLKDNVSRPKTLSVSKTLVASMAIVFMSFSALMIFIGTQLTDADKNIVRHYERIAPYKLDQEILVEKEKVKDLQVYLKNNLSALSARLGSLQAQVSRINAVEKRLASAAKISIDDFAFDTEPALGGASDISVGISPESLSNDIESIERALAKREASIEALGVSLSEMVLKEGQTPEGMPVKNGWISSRYGWRISPTSGRKQFHKGVDIPARRGSEVIAVADGIVVRAERQSALGNVVEINHGDGIKTLYAHNSKNVVSVGTSVSKGDKIAEVGSTGRSTGPHVHFQVSKNGKIVDPKSFIR